MAPPTRWARLVPRSLSSRLVITAVLLVALAALAIGTATTLAMQSYLQGQLDDDVRASLTRAYGSPVPDGDLGRPEHRRGDREAPLPQVGSLIAVSTGTTSAGEVVEAGQGAAVTTTLSSAALDRLTDVPSDGEGHSVRLPGLGDYRVAARALPSGGVVIAGLPQERTEDVLERLLLLEVLAALLAVVGAAALGRVVVRRQLGPLREVAGTAHRVAELPLAEGEIELADRVPGRLTDERTEVGQVGAALNTLLAHVESSLDARHRSEQQVRRFVADASHELRTPIATIQGYAELARRHPDDETAVLTALAKVETESVRMAALVGDLLMLARLDAGRPLERRPVDLTRVLLEAVSDARVLAPGHHWRLALPDDAVEVSGDALALHQVVTNLLTNARKYTPDGTTVTVSARMTADSVEVVVHDDGPGFPEDLVGSAFERFARGDAARTRTVAGQESGVGLGLSLVRAIVEAHGGRAGLTSRPGDTRVEIRLPRAG